MKVRTLLNKINLEQNQYIKIIDESLGYCVQGFDKKYILEECSKSKVINFQYIKDMDCFLININKRKE